MFADGNYIHYEPGKAPKYDHRICELHAFPGWYKPRPDLKSYRGESRLLLLVADGLAVLNPDGQGEASCHRIELNDLSFDDATTLWGPAHSGGVGIQTFDLIAEWESNFETNACETNVYHVDMKFSNNVLDSYRVRGIAITQPQWINVHRNTPGDNSKRPSRHKQVRSDNSGGKPGDNNQIGIRMPEDDSKRVCITKDLTVKDLAQKLKLSDTEVIKHLFMLGVPER